MIRYVLFSLRFFIPIVSRQAQTHCRAVTFRAVGFSRMQRFLMLNVFVSTSVSHAVELSDALADSERWERIRHVAVKAIPRINAGGLVAKRALLDIIATASEPDAVEVSFLLQSLRVCSAVLFFVLIRQILTTAGILDAAATLMKRPSSSEQVRGEFVNSYVDCRCVFRTSFAKHTFARSCRVIDIVNHRVLVSSTITDVTSGSVRCLSGLSVMNINLGSVPPFCVGWTGNGGCAACFKCLWCRCKIRGNGVPEDVRSHIVVRTCEMMKVVASATCSLECSRNRRVHSLTFTRDMFNMFCLHCVFFSIHIVCQPGTDTLSCCNFFALLGSVHDATFLDVECVCFDQ